MFVIKNNKDEKASPKELVSSNNTQAKKSKQKK